MTALVCPSSGIPRRLRNQLPSAVLLNECVVWPNATVFSTGLLLLMLCSYTSLSSISNRSLPSPAESLMSRREFQFSDGSSNKFWAIEVSGTSQTVHFGKIGTTGQAQTKEFASEAEAKKAS